jgi:hypothetical protein
MVYISIPLAISNLLPYLLPLSNFNPSFDPDPAWKILVILVLTCFIGSHFVCSQIFVCALQDPKYWLSWPWHALLAATSSAVGYVYVLRRILMLKVLFSEHLLTFQLFSVVGEPHPDLCMQVILLNDLWCQFSLLHIYSGPTHYPGMAACRSKADLLSRFHFLNRYAG